MLNLLGQPIKFNSKEPPTREVLVEFDSAEHFNGLISETWCPWPQRVRAAREKACVMQIIILCETDEEAIRTAKYHYYAHGSNFRIIASVVTEKND